MLAEKYHKLEKLILKLYTVLTKFQRTKQVLIILEISPFTMVLL